MSTPFLSETVFSPWLTPVRLVETSNLVGEYYNGPNNNGVNSTLTLSTTSLTVDSVVCNLGDRLLLINQTFSSNNGVYVVMKLSPTVVLQRASDQHSLEQIQTGQYLSVEAGTLNAGNFYTVVEPRPQQLGVDSLTWAQNSGGAGSGTVNPGLANTVAFYPANGDAVSGLGSVGVAGQTLASNGPGLPPSFQNTPGATGFIVASTSPAPIPMFVNNIYQPNNAGLVTLLLPIASNLGDTLLIAGFGPGLWTIAQNANQYIQIGQDTTTVGVGGSLSSTNRYDGLKLYCVEANRGWQNVSSPQSQGLLPI